MEPTIRPFATRNLDAVVDLSLRAWEPVFASVADVLRGSGVYEAQHPDWRHTQREAVERACGAEHVHVWVADVEDTVAGFTAMQLHEPDRMGEIHMLAVDPSHQRRGVASALTSFAVRWIADRGMTTAMVETGGDPGHAPARATYERAGFTALPTVKYFRTV
ncbi:GNAT family N-acetyltransferase [Pseudonocardia sp.]|uniref:GNAT family N-acetyltransferase n=1 Tax=Pseudonocardia sp. TaxID=60912 RepID=UPI00262D24E8|nr:GNAT family N-acetyltransferase [Pseudonocardia sp.]